MLSFGTMSSIGIERFTFPSIPYSSFTKPLTTDWPDIIIFSSLANFIAVSNLSFVGTLLEVFSGIGRGT